jgi:fatty-acyl-CoA synthase
MTPSGSQLSYVCGTTAEPLLYQTVGGTLARAAERWPERDALVSSHQSQRLSYRELDARVDRLAQALRVSGLRPGDRLGIWAPNCVEWVLVQFATARAGIVLVNVNPAYRAAELRFALQKSGCKALVLAASFKSSNYIEMIRSLLPAGSLTGMGAVACAELPALELVVHLAPVDIPGFLSFSALTARAAERASAGWLDLRDSTEPDQPINIQFTSGTTGLPKGATLTHFNIVNNGYFVGRGLRLTEQDRICIPVPLYHCFGMVLGVLAAVTHGACVVFPGDSFDAEAVLRCACMERCTALYGVPTMFIAELDHPSFARFDLSCLRTGIMAGAPCPIEIMRRVMDEMHMSQITICYGMTETSPVSFQSSVDDPAEKRVGTVGRIHPHVQVKVVDADGRPVHRGETGELCTRGYSVMRGYWEEPERTAEAIDAAGWMHTGDLAVLDEQGYCYIVGRVKDMIIRGGENIYPRELEEFLYGHPKLLDVAVVGVSDGKYGEEVCAVIRLREGIAADAEEIRAYCRGQIAHYKVPRYVRFVDAFPMTVTGKIQKFVLRQWIEAELAGGRTDRPDLSDSSADG